MSSTTFKLAPAAGLAVLLATAPLAQAQDRTIELKLAHWVPASHPLHKGFEEWGQSVEKASGRDDQVQDLSVGAARQGV